jgi:OOP family OmpA-OmpF porin
VSKFTGAIRGITFEFGSAAIAKSSEPTLDEAAGLLAQYPDLRLEIRGHTDSTGDAASNKKLSKARADAVKNYLVDKGVGASRLQTVGLGPDEPIASNDTDEGRRKNRRIEFKLLSR